MRPAFEDLLARFHADYVDLDMIHYVDKVEEYEQVVLGDSPFMRYVRELRAAGIIHHIGLSTHNTEVTRRVTENPEIEMVLFSVNPAFDTMPATDNLGDLFGDYAGVGGGRHQRRPRRALRERVRRACERLHRVSRVRGPLSLWRQGGRQDGRGGRALRALSRSATSARGGGPQ